MRLCVCVCVGVGVGGVMGSKGREGPWWCR